MYKTHIFDNSLLSPEQVTFKHKGYMFLCGCILNSPKSFLTLHVF